MIVFDDYCSDPDFTRLYQSILRALLYDHNFEIAPRGMKINEIVNASVIIDPESCRIDFSKTGAPERQEVYDRYCKEELAWYLSGDTRASSAPSKFWNQLADDTGHITSNYGHMMLHDRVYPPSQDAILRVGMGVTEEEAEYQTAIDRVVSTLTKDLDSRQAIVHYNQPRHCYPENKDFPCTVYSQFFVREGDLYMTTYQRSCDIIKGFSYDVPWNCHFYFMVLRRLQAAGLKVQNGGTFTHVFGSLHLYHKDLELAKRIAEVKP